MNKDVIIGYEEIRVEIYWDYKMIAYWEKDKEREGTNILSLLVINDLIWVGIFEEWLPIL